MMDDAIGRKVASPHAHLKPVSFQRQRLVDELSSVRGGLHFLSTRVQAECVPLLLHIKDDYQLAPASSPLPPSLSCLPVRRTPLHLIHLQTQRLACSSAFTTAYDTDAMTEVASSTPSSRAAGSSSTTRVPPPVAIPTRNTLPKNQYLGLDAFSPVNQNGSFDFDRVLKSGDVNKRSRRTKVRQYPPTSLCTI